MSVLSKLRSHSSFSPNTWALNTWVACALLSAILAGAGVARMSVRSNSRVAAGAFRTPEEYVAAGGGRTGFPAWVPLYPGAVVENLVGLEGGKRRHGMCYLSTTASWDRITMFYSRELRKRGYHAQQELEKPGFASLVARDGKRSFRLRSAGSRLALFFSEEY